MGRNEVLEGHSRVTRKVRRQKIGKLKDLVVKPQTRKRYEEAMRKLFEFLKWNRIALPSQYEQLDSIASRYIEELWEEGESRYLAQDTVSALQHYEPQLKRRTLESWRLIKAWQKHEIPTRAPPLTPATLAVLAGWMHSQMPQLALALALAFFALLRTGELFQIKNQDVICSGDVVVVHLGQTKMAARNAGTESTSFRHREVSLMLQSWKAVTSRDALLVSVSPSSFRHWFSKALQETGLNELPYKPYSLRRGGATQVFLDSQSYAAVCQRGRWAAEKSARIYIQDSIALLTQLPKQLSVKQREYHALWTGLVSRLERSSTSARRRRGRG